MLRKLFGTQNDRAIARLNPMVAEINAMEKGLSALSDDAIREKVSKIRGDLARDLNDIKPDLDRLRDMISSSTVDTESNKYKKELKDKKNAAINKYLNEVFAIVREASKRTIGLRHFDVQLMGGMVLHEGKIAEMATGEGKTLVATLPVCLNAFSGENVHVVTVNDYLAKRDAEWMGKIYAFLGLTVGVIQHDMSYEAKKKAYASNVVYGTNNEFGFDYLRDNMVADLDDTVQGAKTFVIVDEVDSILIDEARTPLIISGPVDETNESYNLMRPIVEEVVRYQKREVNEKIGALKNLVSQGKKDEAGNTLYLIHKADPKNREFLDLVLKDRNMKALLDKSQSNFESKIMEKEKDELLSGLYYVFDEKSRESTFSEKGQKIMKERFGIEFMIEDVEASIAELAEEDISEDEKAKKEAALTAAYIDQEKKVDSLKQLLKAYILFEKDVDYVVNENKIVIVDSFTGRMMPGRRFSDGIHEALEAKERVEVQRESQTLATITLQNYFRMYEKLAGMTGTAKTEEMEFEKIYLLPVLQMPTNKPMNRENMPDRIYKTEKEKFDAVVAEVEEWNKKGRPVLVGTISIEKSERLSKLLNKKGIRHNVLNAKYHEREAHIVAQAGRYGAVTIATNMAGRGTDIILGGNAEYIAMDKVEKMSIEDPEEKIKAFNKFLNETVNEVKEEHNRVVDAGGLHIIGTERHESRRIDNQLRGRSGRQGDPGSSRFYLSLEDDLMRIFGSDRIKAIMDRLGMEEGEVIENPLVTRAIGTAQKRVETQNFEIRKHLLKYDDIMNRQRDVIYARRRMILKSDDLKNEYLECLGVAVEDIAARWDEDPDETRLSREMMHRYAVNIKGEKALRKSKEELIEMLIEDGGAHFSERESYVGRDKMLAYQKMVMLSVIDSNWKEYLREIDDLREGISWRAYAQKDPFVEFQYEAFRMFHELMVKIDSTIAERGIKITFLEDVSRKVVHRPENEVLEHREYSLLGQGAGDLGPVNREQTTGNRPQGLHAPGPVPRIHGSIERHAVKVGRNDPCPCGSGKKYKKCCGK